METVSGEKNVLKTELIVCDFDDDQSVDHPSGSNDQPSIINYETIKQKAVSNTPASETVSTVQIKEKQRKSKNKLREKTDGKIFEHELISNKFDFGDRDQKPAYHFALPSLEENEGKDWTIEELKTLHECINTYGVNDNCLFHATKNITMRSMSEIREKISEIRKLARLRREMRSKARSIEWLKQIVKPSKTSEIQNWSSALKAIQERKRRITDYTDLALQDYFVQEIKCRTASSNTRKLFRVTDSPYARGAARREMIDCSNYYRYLQSFQMGATDVSYKSFDAAVILSILEGIQEEVDDAVHEKRRRILAGMYRDIQSGDLSEYDFRDIISSEDMLSIQLNPLGMMRDMLETRREQSAS